MSDQYVTQQEFQDYVNMSTKKIDDSFLKMTSKNLEFERMIKDVSSQIDSTNQNLQTIQQQLTNGGLIGSTYDQNVRPGQMLNGGLGSQWTVSNPAAIAEYNASKAAVDPNFYDCRRKILVDEYGRKVDQQTLPIWTCPGDNPDIAIDREDAINRLAYNELQPYVRGIPPGLLL